MNENDSTTPRATESVGVVVIGRNEGERLRRCLQSLEAHRDRLVYVDSDSSDGSVELARSHSADVVELDPGPGLSAARARNAGAARLLELHPDIELLQFVDGDCLVDPGWIDTAREFMQDHARAAAVCGRRRELAPDASPYNRLADLEWDTPIGLAASCGGDAMLRVEPFREAEGYSETLIAGEEPELCLRMRSRGWEIHRIDAEMTRHDADLTRLGQWWKRNVRAGHAAAELVARHGRAAGPAASRRILSMLAWALGPPLLVVLGAPVLGAASLGFLLCYGVLGFKIFRHERSRERSPRHAALYALACTVGKFAELEGIVRFTWNRLFRSGPNQLIEYKGPESPSS